MFDDRSTLPTHPEPKLSCIMTTEYVQIQQTLGSLDNCKLVETCTKLGMRQWVFIGGCCDVTSIGMYTQSTRSTVWGLLGVVLYISLSMVGGHHFLTMWCVCVCVCMCVCARACVYVCVCVCRGNTAAD